jgi:S1-C subfamily serine protease
MSHCFNCGNKVDEHAVYCFNCGRSLKVNNEKITKAYLSLEFSKLPRLTKIFLSTYQKIITLSLLLLIIGLGIFVYEKNQKSFQKRLEEQRTQTAKLQTQLNDVQKKAEVVEQQNLQTTQQFSTELESQKKETEDAKKQTQVAQQALNLLKKQVSQPTTTSNNNFPSVNTSAIVLVVCFDDFGNAQSGSGTIINSAGYVLTNKHVVTSTTGASLTCGVVMNDGSASPNLKKDVLYVLTMNAANAGYYPNYDAALLKIDKAINVQTNTDVSLPASFPFIRPNGGNLKQGDTLYIFGYPGAANLAFNVTRGIVSSFASDNTYINTDAVIDHGNSGGAAITSDGRFIGIPSQKYIANGDYLGQILRVEDLIIP